MALQDREERLPKEKPAWQDPRRSAVGVNYAKSNPAGQRHHCLPKRPAQNRTGLKYLLYPLLVLIVLWYGADAWLTLLKGKSPNSQVLQKQAALGQQSAVELAPGGIMLRADRNGQFRGTALINGVAAPFLIDTGATQTAIPASLAGAAGLKYGRTVQNHTAGGIVTDHMTRIDRLKIGNAEIKNLQATINQHLQEVLIGMNTLKYFRMTQAGDTLTLVASSDPVEIAEIEKDLAPEEPPVQAGQNLDFRQPEDSDTAVAEDKKSKTNWKKSVVCDSRQHCKTVYGEH